MSDTYLEDDYSLEEIRATYEANDKIIRQAARDLGVPESTLRDYLARHGISDPQRRPSDKLADLDPDDVGISSDDPDGDDSWKQYYDEDDQLRADGGTIQACPECDSSHVQPTAKPSTPADYRCGDCGAHFDEPDQREPHGGRHHNAGDLSAQLSEMEPEDLRADGGTVRVCPNCGDSGSLRTRSRSPGYYCRNCNETVEDYEERDRQHESGRLGLAGDLVDLDPDDVAADGGQNGGEH